MQKEELNKLYIEHLRGNKDATYQILKHFDPNISFMLKKYNKLIKYSLDDEEDFIQNCHLAILNALKEYDSSKGDLEPCLQMRLKRVLDMTTPPDFSVSIDEVIDDSGTTICDLIADKRNEIEECDIRNMLSCLTEKERKVFELYYIKKYTTKEIADIMEMSRRGIFKILSRGKEKIKNQML